MRSHHSFLATKTANSSDHQTSLLTTYCPWHTSGPAHWRAGVQPEADPCDEEPQEVEGIARNVEKPTSGEVPGHKVAPDNRPARCQDAHLLPTAQRS
eukprot:5818557-Amphidinium_carterae.1